jgi:hypothetical protein
MGELLQVILLLHANVLCLPGDGKGDVLAGDENELLMFTFFSMWMFSAYLEMVREMFLMGMRMSFFMCIFFSMKMFSACRW